MELLTVRPGGGGGERGRGVFLTMTQSVACVYLRFPACRCAVAGLDIISRTFLHAEQVHPPDCFFSFWFYGFTCQAAFCIGRVELFFCSKLMPVCVPCVPRCTSLLLNRNPEVFLWSFAELKQTNTPRSFRTSLSVCCLAAAAATAGIWRENQLCFCLSVPAALQKLTLVDCLLPS